jgi:arginyl-tRNA synthetase
MVDLPSGKMKSREGTVVDADDLMQEMTDTAQKNFRRFREIRLLFSRGKIKIIQYNWSRALKFTF